MEPPSTKKTQGDERTEIELRRDSNRIGNHMVPKGQQQEQPGIARPVPSSSKNFANNFHASSLRHAPKTTRSLPIGNIGNPTHDNGVPFKLLTAQALEELEIQLPGYSSPAKRQRITRVGNLPLSDNIDRDQQSTDSTIPSTYNEADRDTPTYQSTDNQDSNLAYSDNEMYIPGRDTNEVDSTSRQRHSTHKLTPWEGDLAGVGEHLAEHIHPGNAGSDDRITE